MINKLQIIGVVLMGIAMSLVLPIISSESMPPETRLKHEAMGAGFLSETSSDYRKKLLFTAGGFLLSGISCLMISGRSGKKKPHKK